MEKQCTHKSFSSEQVDVSGANIKIGIIRCSQCGAAIGVLYPQAPAVLNAIGEKLDVLQKEVQKLHR